MARSSDFSTAPFEPIVPRKATELIAEQIRQRIFAREYVTGEMLPSEAELVRQTESSSASVRGALRALEAQGLIQMRSGRSGGAVVQLPGERELASTVNQLIRSQAIGLVDLLEMQQAIEPSCAGLAAIHRTDEHLAELHSALDAIAAANDARSLLQAHSEWHIAIARASNNELLAGLMIALVRWIHVAVQESGLIVERSPSAPYERITDAIEQGNSFAASDAMRRHAAARAVVLGAAARD